MSKRTIGILASVVGSAVGAWWWMSQRKSSASASASERGTVIFDNTPTATDAEGIL